MAVATWNWFASANPGAFGSSVIGGTPNIDFLSDSIKVMLCTSAYVPDQNVHDFLNDVTNEISGTGYTAGGVVLASKALTTTAANAWGVQRANATAYAVGDIVRPATGNGRLYRCIVAGTSGGSVPTFPTVSGQVVADGAVTWAEYGTSITVFNGGALTWSNATFTARVAVMYDDTPSTAATKPLLGYCIADVDVSPNSGALTINPHPNNGYLFSVAQG